MLGYRAHADIRYQYSDALNTVVCIVNLSSESYELHRDQLFVRLLELRFVTGMLPKPKLGRDPTQIYAKTSCKAS